MTGRTRLTALCLAVASVMSFSACGAEAPPPEETETLPAVSVTTPAPEEVTLSLLYAAADSLHPAKATDRSNLDALSLVYEGLYALDENFEAYPVLAESAEVSADGLTWTITPRTDVAFSDGTPLEADHVVSSLKAAMKSTVYSVRLSGITKVRTRKGTVVISLASPNGNLPALLDVPVFLEREEGLPLGTGPYAIDGGDEERWLAANPNWWQGRRPLYDRIPLVATGQLEERVSAFDSGLVTAVTTDAVAADALGYSSIYETHDYTTTDMLFVGFNRGGICADPKIRAALSCTFDRNSVVLSLLDGHGVPASLPMYPGSGRYDEEAAAALDCDLQSAAALLAEAGYTRNDSGVLVRKRVPLRLRFIVNQDSLVKREIAAFLAEDLRQLGLEVTVDELGWDDYLAALTAGEFDLYLGEVILTGDFDITSLTFGSLNYGHYWNETVYTLLQAWKASSGSSRDEAAQALYRAMAEDLPFATLCFKRNSLLIRWGMVKNLAPLRARPFAGVETWETE